MKKTLITISLSLIVFSNIIFARERIKTDANAHVKPTNSTEIKSIELLPTVIHLSETEEIIMETAPTTTTPEETQEQATTETAIISPKVERAHIDDKIYAKEDLPIVGYQKKDTDDPSKAQVEIVQELMSTLSLKPFSFGVRITYQSEINGWAEFDITYKTSRGAFTNTIIKPISRGLNILTLATNQGDAVNYYISQNVYCSEIRRTILEY